MIATSPAIAPVATPSALGLPCAPHSSRVQVSAAAAVATCVTRIAMPAVAVGGKRAAGVEPEPADPEQSRADQREGHVVRRDRRVRITMAAADHERRREPGYPGVDVHHRAAREIQHAPVPHQCAGTAPDHVRQRRVNQSEPESDEDDEHAELHALGECADRQRGRDDREGHLEGREDRFRDGPDDRIRRDARHEGLAEPADEHPGVSKARL